MGCARPRLPSEGPTNAGKSLASPKEAAETKPRRGKRAEERGGISLTRMHRCLHQRDANENHDTISHLPTGKNSARQSWQEGRRGPALAQRTGKLPESKAGHTPPPNPTASMCARGPATHRRRTQGQGQGQDGRPTAAQTGNKPKVPTAEEHLLSGGVTPEGQTSDGRHSETQRSGKTESRENLTPFP